MTDFSMTDSPYEPIFRVGTLETLLAPPLFTSHLRGAGTLTHGLPAPRAEEAQAVRPR
jgi:hypothetical protein